MLTSPLVSSSALFSPFSSINNNNEYENNGHGCVCMLCIIRCLCRMSSHKEKLYSHSVSYSSSIYVVIIRYYYEKCVLSSIILILYYIYENINKQYNKYMKIARKLPVLIVN